ncbi:MAG TPA: hypothetical protein VGL41_03780, partial [Roseiarcus sp.]
MANPYVRRRSCAAHSMMGRTAEAARRYACTGVEFAVPISRIRRGCRGTLDAYFSNIPVPDLRRLRGGLPRTNSRSADVQSSLLAGKNAGNFRRIGRFLAESISKTAYPSVTCRRIPYADEQGIDSREQGIYSRSREFGGKPIRSPDASARVRLGYKIVNAPRSLIAARLIGQAQRSTQRRKLLLRRS